MINNEPSIYCARCGNYFTSETYQSHLVTCVLRSRIFRRGKFRARSVRDVMVGKRPTVRRPDFTSPETPVVAELTQQDRIDGALRARRIRTVHIDPAEVGPPSVSREPFITRVRKWLQQ
jgi:hypothetical protein